MNRFKAGLRRIGMIALLLSISMPFWYVLYHHFYQRGLQAEARLMLGYLHTLQKVYRIEHGTYIYFSFYGAPVNGQDYCQQPLEAGKLGFIIHGCHDDQAVLPRYAYRSLESSQGSTLGYRLEAVSGSDSAGRSLVCFVADGQELWVSSKSSVEEPIKSCW